jgi:hypothetical protein
MCSNSVTDFQTQKFNEELKNDLYNSTWHKSSYIIVIELRENQSTKPRSLEKYLTGVYWSREGIN